MENMCIGYTDFLRLWRVENPEKLCDGYLLKPDGLYLDIPEVGSNKFARFLAILSAEERAAVMEHPEDDISKPVLRFPCSVRQLLEFEALQRCGEHIDQDILKGYEAKTLQNQTEPVTSDAQVAPASETGAPSAVLTGMNNESKEWVTKSVELANAIGLKKWKAGQQQITARNICDSVAIELAKGVPGKPQKYHGAQGPRAAHAIRSTALAGWKFVCPSGTSGTNGTD